MPRPRSPLRLVFLLSVMLGCGDEKGDSATDTGTSTTGTSTGTTGTTGDSTSQTPTTGATTSTVTGTSTTGVDVSGFERFIIESTTGPCPPNTDCDGFVELLASGVLRVEEFGDLGEPVIEVEVSADDFAAAVLVFADPELLALLGDPDPPCQPPTDVLELMRVEIDGATFEALTTACDQSPIAAAREMAVALRMQYVP